MRVALLTREYPPDVYGGAGVHVEYLAAELARLIDVDVHCFGTRAPAGAREPGMPLVIGHPPLAELAGANPALGVLGIDLADRRGWPAVDIVHSHTWYANLAGHLAGLLHGIPHVATTHSLEPLRPWKAEQLGGGYALSSWSEQVGLEGADRVIAVSEGMKADLRAAYPAIDESRISVVYNGVDTNAYRPDPATDVVDALGIDREPPVRRLPRPGDAPEGAAGAAGGRGRFPSRGPAGPAGRARRRRPNSAPRSTRCSRACGGPHRRLLDSRDAAAGVGDPAAHPRRGLRLPVGVRAARHRQPRGDGLRDAGGGQRCRRHPRGGGRRPHRAAGAAVRSGSAGCSGQPAARRPGARGARWGARAASAPPPNSAGGPSPSRPSRSTRRSLPASSFAAYMHGWTCPTAQSTPPSVPSSAPGSRPTSPPSGAPATSGCRSRRPNRSTCAASGRRARPAPGSPASTGRRSTAAAAAPRRRRRSTTRKWRAPTPRSRSTRSA